MDVNGHYDEGVKVILPELGIAEFEAVADTIGNARVFQPERACFSAIELLVCARKFLAGCQSFFGAQLLQDTSGKGAVKAPGQKDCAAFGEPMRQSAVVIGQGRLALA